MWCVPSRCLCRMESEEHILISELNEKIFQIFSDFMSRVTKFEELVAVGSRLLVGFHQGLEFLCRLPINKTSELIERIFKANETRRVLTYVESGCINAHDSIQNISNCFEFFAWLVPAASLRCTVCIHIKFSWCY
ncbi:uncharacterized protein LOC114316658 isoform X1 [Camellia sinensis]|uniref:uncharacterized protein LOC114316658 isoform X1 n=1 Tax=Camellia sinensis TaxID=4442 RepID=UPI00103644E9|nr:uncharacterized protein LOC114316658 isoform X1 [Camellia sinensis]